MRGGQKNDVLLDFAHLAGFAVDGPMRSEKEDRIQGDYGNRHVGPAAAVHVFMIQRNDHGGVSRLKSGLSGSGASRYTGKSATRRRGKAGSASLPHSRNRFEKQTCTSSEFPLSVTPVTPPTHRPGRKSTRVDARG